MLIYVTCRKTAADSGLPLGFNLVPDTLGQSFLDQGRAFTLNNPQALPAIGHCTPGTDLPAAPAPPAAPALHPFDQGITRPHPVTLT